MHQQLVTSLYFALTMLSTVGYGDLYPISNLEMITAVLCMAIGVGLFSVVMNQCITIMEQNKVNMGDPDRRDELDQWILTLERFNNRQKLAKSL